MAVAFGAGSAGVAAHFNSTPSVTGFSTAGSDRVGIAYYGGASGGAISGITWNGVAMTQVVVNTQVSSIADNIICGLYVIVAPPTAASTVAFTFTDDLVGSVGVAYYTGADQSTPIRAGSTASNQVIGGAGGAVAVTSNCTAGDMGIGAAAQYGGTLSSPLGTGVFLTESDTGSERWGAGSYREASGSTVQLGWTYDDDDIVIVAAAIQAAGGGGTPTNVAAILQNYRNMKVM